MLIPLDHLGLLMHLDFIIMKLNHFLIIKNQKIYFYSSQLKTILVVKYPMRFLEHSKTTHALGRVGDVEEVAAMIRFLASKEASFVTGQTIGIDGGRGIMCPR